jgi:hypothetical protein
LSRSKGIIARFANTNGIWKLQSVGYRRDAWTKPSARNHFKSHFKNESQFSRDFIKVRRDFEFIQGSEMGLQNFWSFVIRNNYQVDQDYAPRRESIEWYDDVITQLQETDDLGSQFFHVVLCGATRSFNENPYDAINFPLSIEGLHYLPVNMSHNHSRWLPYPNNRLEVIRASNLSVEGLLRIAPDQDVLLQKLSNDEIVNCSLEALKIDNNTIKFTAVALLERPIKAGLPYSLIEPIVFNSELSEALSHQFSEKWVNGATVNDLRSQNLHLQERCDELTQKFESLIQRETEYQATINRLVAECDRSKKLSNTYLTILRNNGILILDD